jgi:hypothetical protein
MLNVEPGADGYHADLPNRADLADERWPIGDTEAKRASRVLVRRDPNIAKIAHTETACRRAGALTLRSFDLDAEQCLIRLRENGETIRSQPVSPTLMSYLVAHDERGCIDPMKPLLRHRDGRPLSSRRYDYLWNRLGGHLPWVRVQGGCSARSILIAVVAVATPNHHRPGCHRRRPTRQYGPVGRSRSRPLGL